jgi:hypothetical protein
MEDLPWCNRKREIAEMRMSDCETMHRVRKGVCESTFSGGGKWEDDWCDTSRRRIIPHQSTKSLKITIAGKKMTFTERTQLRRSYYRPFEAGMASPSVENPAANRTCSFIGNKLPMMSH